MTTWDRWPTCSKTLGEHLAGRRVLVTGATGFIGSHLVQRLTSVGAQVTAVGPNLGWRPTVPSLVRQGRVRFVKLGAFWNLTSLRRLGAELKETEYVVHLGYAMPRGKSPLEIAIDDVRRNVLGTLRFVQLLPGSISKFVFASSVMVYGLNPPQPVSESYCARPVTVYAAGKLATEIYLRLHAKENGFALSILRYATVYGPMETVPRAIPNFTCRVLADKSPIIYGRGDDVRDYVHVYDVVDATLLSLLPNDNTAGTYNVGTGIGHTTREIAERIIRLAEKNVKPVFKPAKSIPNKIVCDIGRASSALGYKPQMELDGGLIDEFRFFSRNPRFWRNKR